jgi:hypothetical protein
MTQQEQELVAHLCRREGVNGATEDGVVMRACRAYMNRFGRLCFYWESDVLEDLYSEACLEVCTMVPRHFGKDAKTMERLACSTAFNRCFYFYKRVKAKAKRGRLAAWNLDEESQPTNCDASPLHDLPDMDRALVEVALDRLEGLTAKTLNDEHFSDDEWERLSAILDTLFPRRKPRRFEQARQRRIVMRNLRRQGLTLAAIAARFGTSDAVVSRCIKPRRRRGDAA